MGGSSKKSPVRHSRAKYISSAINTCLACRGLIRRYEGLGRRGLFADEKGLGIYYAITEEIRDFFRLLDSVGIFVDSVKGNNTLN